MSGVGLCVCEASCVPDVSHCTFSTRRASVSARARAIRNSASISIFSFAQPVVLTAACSETSPRHDLRISLTSCCCLVTCRERSGR